MPLPIEEIIESSRIGFCGIRSSCFERAVGTAATDAQLGAVKGIGVLASVAVCGITVDRVSGGWTMNCPDGRYRIRKSISASPQRLSASPRLTRSRLTCSPCVVEIRMLVCAGFECNWFDDHELRLLVRVLCGKGTWVADHDRIDRLRHANRGRIARSEINSCHLAITNRAAHDLRAHLNRYNWLRLSRQIEGG